MARVRLIKVIVQPVFVLDDGENVTEIEHPPVAISARDWPTYSGERFPAEVKAWQDQLDAQVSAPRPARTRPKR